MWMVFEQRSGYPPPAGFGQSYPESAGMGVRYLPTALCFSKVVEKKEENVVFNRVGATLSINPILIH
jgi:hypothetical protein